MHIIEPSARTQRAGFRFDLWLVATLLVCAVSYLPLLWLPGIVNTRAGGDSPFLLLRVQQMAAMLAAGQAPVEWLPDAAYGYGYPFFHFYAPLVYYLAAGLDLLGMGAPLAIRFAQVLGFVLAAAGMYGLVRAWTGSRPAALLAAVAYTYAPFHLVNVYVRGDSLAEFWAFALYPLILLALWRLWRRPTWRNAAWLALGYGALALCHNISFLIFSPFLGLAGMALAFSGRRRDVSLTGYAARAAAEPARKIYLLLAGGAAAAGLALSAWYWLPALQDQSLVQLQENLTGYFSYTGHFRQMPGFTVPGGDGSGYASLVQSGVPFDYRVNGGGTPFAMGLVQGALALLGIAGLAVRWFQQAARRVTAEPAGGSAAPLWLWEAALVVTCILAMFFITPASRFVWARIPLLPFVQFPWRFLSVQALAGAALTAGVVLAWPARWQQVAAGVIASMLLLTSGMAALPVEVLPLRAADVTPATLQLYELFTGNIGSTVRAEYLPQAAQPRPYTGPLIYQPGRLPVEISSGAPHIVGGAARLAAIGQNGLGQSFQVQVDTPQAQVLFDRLAFPYWQARLDGQPLELSAAQGSGLLRANLPQGSHTLELQWAPPTRRRLLQVAGALMLGLAILAALWGMRRSRPAIWGTDVALIGAWLVVAAAVMGLGQAQAESHLAAAGVYTQDFDRLPFLHPDPGGVVFQGNVRLIEAQVAVGGTPEVTLRWAGDLAGKEAEVALMSPAGQLFNLPYALDQHTLPLSESSQVVRFAIPAATPAGLYLPRLRLRGLGGSLAALTAGGETRGDIYLAPIRVAADAPGAAGAPSANANLRWYAIGSQVEVALQSARQIGDGRLEVRLLWRSHAPLDQNYATSIRLQDADGQQVAAVDTQPGYGFAPTLQWPVEREVADVRWLTLPVGTTPGTTYRLEVVLYALEGLRPVGQATLPQVALTQATIRPESQAISYLAPWLGISETRLAGHDPAQPDITVEAGDHLPLEILWQGEGAGPPAARLEWRLVNSAGEVAARQELDVTPAYPPERWQVGIVIRQRIALAIPPDLPAGAYHLELGLVTGQPAVPQAEKLRLPGTITVMPTRRAFSLPPLSRQVHATFGNDRGEIALAGYTLDRQGANLQLTLVWQARQAPAGDYKTFVHLFDPATEQIAAQFDGPPGAAQATGGWLAGEVVSQTLTLSLEQAPPGMYRLATGLYRATDLQRLPGSGADGTPLPADRVVLPDVVIVPAAQ
ncbi:MAG: hypothetical protein EXR62_14515 [Chloroflexi bacterium]|nr:hypothetical protein [Chloroflexota bacterium]